MTVIMAPTVNKSVVNVEVVQYVTRSVERVHQDVNNGGLLIFATHILVGIDKRRIKD